MVYELFFFFKQKTAYEMRISDWSSDVCSSDLRRHRFFRARDDARAAFHPVWRPQIAERDDCRRKECADAPRDRARQHARYFGNLARADRARRRRSEAAGARRSEEHTSELQSLMRISYAVFCLTKYT